MKKNFPLALYLSFSVSIFLLLVLGTWQLNKNFVVNKNNKNFKNRNQENALILFSLPDKIEDLTYVKFSKVNLTNNFLYLEPRTFKGKVGYHKISVIQVDGRYLLMNEGFITAKEFIYNNIKKKYEIEGYIITVPEPKFFELKNDIKNDVWYTLNLEDFEKEFDLKLSQYILYQQKGKEDNEFKPVVPNLVSNINNLNYAFTWYFLSIALFIVFLLFYMKNHKKYE